MHTQKKRRTTTPKTPVTLDNSGIELPVANSTDGVRRRVKAQLAIEEAEQEIAAAKRLPAEKPRNKTPKSPSKKTR